MQEAMPCSTTFARKNLYHPLSSSAVGGTLNFPPSAGGRHLTPSAHPQPFSPAGHSCADFQQLLSCCTACPSQRLLGGQAFTSTLKPSTGETLRNTFLSTPGLIPPDQEQNSSSLLPAIRERGCPIFNVPRRSPAVPRTHSAPTANRSGFRRRGSILLRDWNLEGCWARHRSLPDVCLSEPSDGQVTKTGQDGGGWLHLRNPANPRDDPGQRRFSPFSERLESVQEIRDKLGSPVWWVTSKASNMGHSSQFSRSSGRGERERRGVLSRPASAPLPAVGTSGP